MSAGQPTKYRESYVEQVKNLCLLGLKDSEIATAFGIRESTLNNWKKAHPKFMESLVEGRENADAEVVRALYNRALGYNAPEETKTEIEVDEDGNEKVVKVSKTIKHIPPEVRAAQYWLNNRQSGRWANKQEIAHSGEIVYNCDYGPKDDKSIK